MKVLALLTLASLAVALPQKKPGQAVTTAPAPASSSTAPAASTVTTACYNNACGGGYPWKRDDEELEARDVEDLEARQKKPGQAVTTTAPAPASSSTAPAASTVTTACYNNACGGGYPWKRDGEEELEAREVEDMEARQKKPGQAVTTTAPAPASSSTAPAASTVTTACYNNACGGGYPW